MSGESDGLLIHPCLERETMGECFTCGGAASERYEMVLDSDTVLEDVVMCEACRASHESVPWIEIVAAPVFTRERASSHVSEATD